MKCWFMTDGEQSDAVFVSERDCFICKKECSPTEEKQGQGFIEKWEIRERQFERCDAESDNGIDHSESETYTYGISFGNLVFENELCIGVYLKAPDTILYFADPSEQSITVIDSEDYEPGWGTVTEGSTYRLCEK